MLPVDSAFFRALVGLGCVAVDFAKDSNAGPWALSKKGYFVQFYISPQNLPSILFFYGIARFAAGILMLLPNFKETDDVL